MYFVFVEFELLRRELQDTHIRSWGFGRAFHMAEIAIAPWAIIVCKYLYLCVCVCVVFAANEPDLKGEDILLGAKQITKIGQEHIWTHTPAIGVVIDSPCVAGGYMLYIYIFMRNEVWPKSILHDICYLSLKWSTFISFLRFVCGAFCLVSDDNTIKLTCKFKVVLYKYSLFSYS